jgi:hypothetical protein
MPGSFSDLLTITGRVETGPGVANRWRQRCPGDPGLRPGPLRTHNTPRHAPSGNHRADARGSHRGRGRDCARYARRLMTRRIGGRAPGIKSANEKTPSEEGVSSVLGVASQELAFDASYGGGGNCTRVPWRRNGVSRNELRRWRLPSAGYWLGGRVTASGAGKSRPSVAETLARH